MAEIPNFKDENITLAERASMSEKERDKYDMKIWDKNIAWIYYQLNSLNKDWIMVIDREVIRSGYIKVGDYPDREAILSVCKEHDNKVPYIFVRPRLIEEC